MKKKHTHTHKLMFFLEVFFHNFDIKYLFLINLIFFPRNLPTHHKHCSLLNLMRLKTKIDLLTFRVRHITSLDFVFPVVRHLDFLFPTSGPHECSFGLAGHR
uniref:Uncharacterized protein n=1 Tax=Cacopsylla melanoneura TaxID=428564 RepID=A0A8D8WUU8_9HEMI